MEYHGISWNIMGIYIYGDIYKGMFYGHIIGKIDYKWSFGTETIPDQWDSSYMALNLCFLMLKHPLPSNGKHGDLLLLLLVTSTGYFALGRP